MSGHNHLVFAILQFLDQEIQTGGHSSDAVESLEVAKQCLESAYGISQESGNPTYQVPASLPDLFNAGLATYGLQAAPLREATSEEKEEAEKHKAEGNELMKQEKFQEALECYSRAINKDQRNAVFYCNRAAALSKLNKHEDALGDCETALKIDPAYSKAYGRKGLALSALNRHSEACECYRKALELDPENQSYKQNLDIAMQKSQTEAPSMGGLNLGGMDFTSFLNNPALMNMASSMMANPQMQSLMANMMSGGGAQPEGQMGISDLLQTGQQLAQQMQQSNPELVEQLRQQYRQPGDQDSNPQNPPGGNAN